MSEKTNMLVLLDDDGNPKMPAPTEITFVCPRCEAMEAVMQGVVDEFLRDPGDGYLVCSNCQQADAHDGNCFVGRIEDSLGQPAETPK